MFDLSRRSHTPIAQWWWTVDKIILTLILALMTVGGMLSLAATPTLALRFNLPLYYFVMRHVFFFLPSLVVMLWLSLLSVSKIKKIALGLFCVSLVGMFLCLFLGPSVKGSHRWIYFFGLTIQPSEFIKPAFVVLVAQFLAQPPLGSLRYFFALGLYALAAGALLLQPDFGQMLLLTATLFILFFVAQAPFALMGSFATLSAVLGGFCYFTFPHVAHRINSFLTPKGYDTYQTDKAIQAFYLGGLFGKGPGEGVVKKILPDAHTDFIFSVAAEEYGGIFALFIVLLFTFLSLKCFIHALREEHYFLRTAICGLTTLFAMQTCINIAVNIHLIPTKGMTLPFISYGGSSMIAVSITMGMLLALTRKDAGLRV